MMSAFEVLGLRVGLVISDEEVREAFRGRGAVLHPDAGGDEVDFAGAQAAQEILLSPGKRLGEWMRVKGIEVEKRGEIGGDLMELFGRVAEVSREAEGLIREMEGAKTVLAKAVLEVKMMGVRERLKEVLEVIGGEIGKRVDCFGGIETGDVDAGVVMRDLIFLEKWRGAMRNLFGRLI